MADSPNWFDAVADRERLLTGFEAAWSSGKNPAIEDFLRAGSAHADILASLVRIDMEFRVAAGDEVSVDDYCQRFPELAQDDKAVQSLRKWQQSLLVPSKSASLSGWPTVPGFDILDELGKGGMGVVYKAWQPDLKRFVALKMVRTEFAQDAEQLRRFRMEAEAVAKLQHPNIVPIFEVGECQGSPYFAVEYLESGSLAAKLQHQPQQAGEAAQLMLPLVRAVAAAHAKNIIHRDLKPANILLTPDGTPKVTDFGLAKHLGSEQGQTRSGDIFGTPAYMSPEQADGNIRGIGPATDVWALGIILYELLTGRPPFQGETTLKTLELVKNHDPAPLTCAQPRTPRDLETICLKCLRKEPQQRYLTATALAEDLERFLDGRPIRARRVGPFERLVKWARRRPAAAALLALSAFTLASIGGLGWYALELRNRPNPIVPRVDRPSEGEPAPITEMSPTGALAFSPDNRTLAVANAGSTVKLLDLKSKLVRATLAGHKVVRGPPGIVNDLAFSPDGKLLATAGDDGTVRLWGPIDGREVKALRGYELGITCVAFSPNSRRLATGEHDGRIHLWDIEARASLPPVIAEIPFESGNVDNGLAFTPDGKWLVSGQIEGHNSAVLWDMSTRKVAKSFVKPGGFFCIALTQNLDSPVLLATGQRDGSLSLWNVDVKSDKKEEREFRPFQAGPIHRMPEGLLTSLAFSPDGQLLASAGQDRTIRLWDVPGRTFSRELRGPSAGPDGRSHVAFSPDGKLLAASGTTLHMWDTATWNELPP